MHPTRTEVVYVVGVGLTVWCRASHHLCTAKLALLSTVKCYCESAPCFVTTLLTGTYHEHFLSTKACLFFTSLRPNPGLSIGQWSHFLEKDYEPEQSGLFHCLNEIVSGENLSGEKLSCVKFSSGNLSSEKLSGENLYMILNYE